MPRSMNFQLNWPVNRYAEYKDSGVEWIGEIPSHWERKCLKYSMIILMGQSPSSENCNHDQIGKPFLQGCKEFGLHSPNSVEQFCITPPRISPKGAILMSVRAPVGKLNFADQEYGIGRGLCAFVQIQDISHIGYFYYLLNSLVHGLNAVSSGSTYDAVSVREIGVLPIVVPPIQVQVHISHYLDKKTSQIDALIEKIERKIELLIEQRTTLISQCVTKGLDPNVQMEDSGVEWIGEIPSHWEIGLLKHFLSHINIKRHAKNNESKISPENVESGTGKILDHQSDYKNIGMEFEFGDTLLNKLRVYLAKVVFCEFSGLSIGEMIVLRPTSIDPKFQFYLLSSCRFIDYLNSLSEGVKMPRTPIDGIMKSRLPITTLREQSQISQFLDKKTSQIDSLSEKLQRKIELLKEYRQSLISNVVTGKVKVTEDAS